MNQRERIFTY